jgi:hypothetical protein
MHGSPEWLNHAAEGYGVKSELRKQLNVQLSNRTEGDMDTQRTEVHDFWRDLERSGRLYM